MIAYIKARDLSATLAFFVVQHPLRVHLPPFVSHGAFLAKLSVWSVMGAALAALIPATVQADMWPDEPGIYPNRDYLHQQFAEHIDPFSGNLQLHYVDGFAAGNGGFDLKITRSYNALATAQAYSPFGGGWQMHFGRAYFPNQLSCTGGPLSIDLPDGSHQTLYPTNGVGGTAQGTDYITMTFWRGNCNAAGVLTVYSPNGTRYDMTEADETTRLTSKITDRHGNYATLTYTTIAAWGHKAVASITTNDGRSANFSYGGGLLSSVTIQGRVWSYTVTNSGGATLLTRVQPPTGGAWTYTYQAGGSLVQSTQNPQGGSTTYSYVSVNFMPGIIGVPLQSAVASKSNSLGTWNFSYSPSASAGVYDTTTVSLPSGIGTITYKHFGINTVNAGDVWKIGSLYQKLTGSEQIETFSWSPLVISNQSQTRAGYFKSDTTTNRALMASQTITRDGGSFTTQYTTFDTFGNPQSIIESGSGSRTRTLSYFNSLSKWIIGIPDDETIGGVGTISRSHDTNGNLISESRYGVTTSYGYDGSGSVSSKTDARGNQTTYGSYAFGIPRSESRPAGVSITRSVDNYGNVASETDGEFAWTFGHDGLNRVTSVGHPTGSDASISWTPTSRSLTRGGYNETMQFDSFGRTTSITREGVTQTFQYDALNRKTFESLPGSSLGTTYPLDILGRVKSATSPAGTRSYSYGGSTMDVTSERSKTTTYTYTRYGNPDEGFLVTINAPAGNPISMSRDAVGTLLSATQDGVMRTYRRDSHLFLTSLIEPETGTTNFGRDAVGNMTSKDMGSVSIGYSYDGLNRLSTISYGGSAGTDTFSYDRRSKVTQVSNPTAVRNYSYDANGNLTLDRLTVDGQTFDVSYAYDGIDGLSTITYPQQMSSGARIVSLTPDTLGRPTTLSPYLSGISYRTSGNLNSFTYANGVSTSIGEDSQRQIPNSISASAIGLSMNYGYDPVGNVTSITGFSGSPVSGSFGYDNIDRLTSASGPWGSGTIQYGGTGNIALKQIGSDSVTYYYASGNRLTGVTQNGTSFNYTYDGLGNTTNNGRNALAYDNASSLTCVDCGTPGEIRYAYDGKGWRVWQEKNGAKTYFQHAPNGDLLFEYSPLGAQWKQHVYLAGKRVATRASDPAPTTTSLAAVTSGTCELNSQYSSLVSLAATVTPSTATGTVLFSGQGIASTVPLVNGVATLSANLLAAGVAQVTAQYSGDSGFASSTSSPALSICVPRRTPTVSMTVAPSIPNAGQAFAVTATVSGVGGLPTGNATLTIDAGTPMTSALVSGSVVFNVAGVSPGSHSLNVHYLGDTVYRDGTATATLSTSGPTVSLTSPTEGQILLAGHPTTLTATASEVGGTIASVSFFDGATLIGTVFAAPFTTSWTTTVLDGHTLTAQATDGVNVTATSSPVHVVIRSAGPAVTFIGGSLAQQSGSSSCNYTQMTEDVSGNWSVTCGAGTKSITIYPAVSGATCAAYSSMTEDVNGAWTVNGCISP